MDGGVALTHRLTEPPPDLFSLGTQSTRQRGLQRRLALRKLELRTHRGTLLLEHRALILEAPLAQPPPRRRVRQRQCFALGLVCALRGLTRGTLLSERACRVRQLPVQRLELYGRLRQPPLRRLRTLLMLLEGRQSLALHLTHRLRVRLEHARARLFELRAQRGGLRHGRLVQAGHLCEPCLRRLQLSGQGGRRAGRGRRLTRGIPCCCASLGRARIHLRIHLDDQSWSRRWYRRRALRVDAPRGERLLALAQPTVPSGAL